MPKIYTTIQGDTWDMIAFKVYGKEAYASRLMDSNRRELKTVIFPAGVKLVCPDEDAETSALLPPWRR